MKTLIATLLACCVLSGCNTVAGIGEDITGLATWSQNTIGGGY